MSKLFHSSYNLLQKLKLVGLIISGISLFTMMLFIVADVIGRNFLSQSIPGNFEIVINYFLPLTVFTAIPYAYGTGIFPRITMISDKFSKRNQSILMVALLLFEAFLFSLVIYYSLNYAISGTNQGLSFPAGGNLYPYYLLLYLVPLSLFLVIIEIIFLIIKNLKEKEPTLVVDDKKTDLGA